METIYSIKTCKIKLKIREQELQIVKEPASALKILRSVYADLDVDQQHFVILCLNSANSVTGYKVLFSGGQSESICDVRVLFRNALLMGATSLILAHNHPSGRIEPTAEDRKITSKIVTAGAMLDIKILDHIILGDNSSYSFSEHGTL